MKKIMLLIILGAFLCVIGTKPSHATVQVGALGEFGFGGDQELEYEWDGGHAHDDEDLDATMGFGIYVETPIAMENKLIIGFETRFLWVELDHHVHEDLYWDLAPYIKFSYPVATMLNVYLRAVPGFSIYFPYDNDYDTGFGLNMGAFVGPEFKFTENFGIFAEMGVLYHLVFGDVDVHYPADFDGEYEIDFIQFHINIGLFVRF